jgi:hypothetical protein
VEQQDESVHGSQFLRSLSETLLPKLARCQVAIDGIAIEGMRQGRVTTRSHPARHGSVGSGVPIARPHCKPTRLFVRKSSHHQKQLFPVYARAGDSSEPRQTRTSESKRDRARPGTSGTISLRNLRPNLHRAACADSRARFGEPSSMQTAGSARDRLFRLRRLNRSEAHADGCEAKTSFWAGAELWASETTQLFGPQRRGDFGASSVPGWFLGK